MILLWRDFKSVASVFLKYICKYSSHWGMDDRNYFREIKKHFQIIKHRNLQKKFLRNSYFVS